VSILIESEQDAARLYSLFNHSVITGSVHIAIEEASSVRAAVRDGLGRIPDYGNLQHALNQIIK
jgi:hypothetical protein